MAAILKLRRDSTLPSLVQSELFYHTTENILYVGDGSSQIRIVKIGSNTGSIEFTGAVTSSHISASGDVIANNISASNLALTGNAVIDGNITLGGNIYLGDQIADNINVTAQFSGSLIPSASNEYDLGSSVKKWKNLWVVSASIDDLSVGGSGILSSSVTDFITFSSSVDTRLDNNESTGSDHENRLDTLETTFSSSVDLRLDTLEGSFSSSVDSRLDLLESTGSNHETRIDIIEGAFSSSVDLRLDNTESTGSDHESRIDVIETSFSSSVDTRLDNTESTGSNHETRLDIIEGTFSSSLDSRLDYLETTFSGSVDTRLDNVESTGSNHESRIDVIETTFSSSVDIRLDDLESFSASLDNEFLNTNGDNVISGSDQVTSSLDLRYLQIDGDNVFSQSSQVNADTITNFDSNVKDKMNLDGVVSGSSQILNGSGILSSSNENFSTFSSSIDSRVVTIETTFSSSVDSRLDELEGNFSSSVSQQLDGINLYTSSLKSSIEVNGSNLTVLGNLTVQGTQTSLNTTDLLVEDKLIAIASGSTTSAESDGAGIYISGANASLIWNHSDSLLEFNTKISSSVGFKGDGSEISGVTAADVEYINVLNKPTLLSSSQQISDYGVFAELNGDNLVSSSQQISNYNTFLEINGDNVLSSSQQISNYGVFAELNGDNLVSSSAQVIGHLPNGIISGSTFTTFSSSVDTRLDTLETTFSSSVDTRLDYLETTFSSSVDTRLDNTESTGSDHENRLDTLETTFSSSVDTRLDTLETTFSSSVDTRLDNTESTGSDHENRLDTLETSFSSSVDSRLDIIEGTFSSSVDTRLDSLENFSSSQYITDSSSFDDRLDNIETFTSSIDGRVSTLEGTSHSHSNKANLDTINQDLSITSDASFNSLNLTNVVTDSSVLNALFLSSSDEVVYRGLGSSAFIHYSQSINDGNPAVIGTAGAVKTYVDAKIIAAGAGDITEVIAGGGLFGGAPSGAAVLTLDTASAHFNEGVHTKVDDLKLISGSSQLTSSFVQKTGDETIAGIKTFTGVSTNFNGNVIIQGDLSALGSLTYISSSIVNIEDNVIRVNYGGAQVDGGIQVTDGTGVNTITGSLLYDANLDYWKAGKSGTESKILLERDGIISQSSQVNVTQTTNYSAINQYSDSKVETFINNKIVHSGSYLGTATTSDLTEGVNEYYTDAKVLSYINGLSVLSGSIDVSTLATTSSFNSYTQSNNLRVQALENWSSSLDSSYVTEGELTTLSQSIDNTISTKLDTGSYNLDSQSFDSRIDTLEGTSNENPLTFSDTTTIELVRTGDTITANAIGGIISSSIQIDNLGFLQVNGDSVVSSSAQVISLLPNGVISGSSQIIAGSGILSSSNENFTTFSSSVDLRLDNSEYTSSQLLPQVGQLTSNVSSIHNFTSSIDNTIKNKLNTESVISGSSQVLGGSGIVSSSNQISNYGVFAELNGDSLVSSSNQISNYGVFAELNGDNLVSSSQQVKDLGFVDLSSVQTISGTKTFENIVVNGTGSFAYIQSTTGSAKIIGDAFIVLNNDTPTERYAGVSVYDSGSAGVTASLQFDGQTNDWFYEYSTDGGVTTDHGVVLFGPEYSGIGNPTYLTNNKIPKSVGSHHLNDSNITDSGTLITLGSNIQVSGNISVTGTVDGVDIANLDTNFGTLKDKTLVSGSSQITLGGDVTGNATASVVGKIQGVALTSGEATQLANINTSTISATQWGYLGSSNQGIATSDDVTFNTLTLGVATGTAPMTVTSTTKVTNLNADLLDGITSDSFLRSDANDTASGVITFSNTTNSTSKTTGAVIVSGGVGIAKTLNVGEDVIAYATSDRRLKDEIQTISNPIEKINQIGGYSFVWNREKQNIYNGKDYGVIAQEIEEILPELVQTRENGYKAVKYDKLVSLLIEGIKELSKEVEELKKK